MSKNGVITHEFNYVTANRFYVEMESTITASFSECSGLSVKVKKEARSEGGVNDQQRIILGPAEFSEVTLKRGVTDNLTFWNWMNSLMTQRGSGVAFREHRRNVNILTFNQGGETMQCWTLIGAVPIAWKAPSLTAEGKSVAVEELTLAYEGLKVVAKTGGGGATILSERGQSGYFSSN